MNRVTRLLVHFGLSRKQAATLSNTTEEKVKEFESKTTFTQQEEKILSAFFGSAWEESADWVVQPKAAPSRPKGRKGIAVSLHKTLSTKHCGFEWLFEAIPELYDVYVEQERMRNKVRVCWKTNNSQFCCWLELTYRDNADTIIQQVKRHIKTSERL